MTRRNKHTSMLIKKKSKNSKRPHYRCCVPIAGNRNKVSRGYCCTYPLVYKRQDNYVICEHICRNRDDEIILK